MALFQNMLDHMDAEKARSLRYSSLDPDTWGKASGKTGRMLLALDMARDANTLPRETDRKPGSWEYRAEPAAEVEADGKAAAQLRLTRLDSCSPRFDGVSIEQTAIEIQSSRGESTPTSLGQRDEMRIKTRARTSSNRCRDARCKPSAVRVRLSHLRPCLLLEHNCLTTFQLGPVPRSLAISNARLNRPVLRMYLLSSCHGLRLHPSP